MARIALRRHDALKPVTEFSTADEKAGPGVETRVAFPEKNPIATRWHTLAPGANVTWSNSGRGHVIYVWAGSVRVGELVLDAGSGVVIEHGGSTRVTGGQAGGEILVFNATDACETPAEGTGGNVHLLPASEVPRAEKMSEQIDVGGAFFADSRCPTCRLWLHENQWREDGPDTSLHSHSEDEVIVVIKGEIVLGQQRHGRGAALFIAKNTLYNFTVGKDGMDFLNFRPGRPTYRPHGSDHDIDEVGLYDAVPPLIYR